MYITASVSKWTKVFDFAYVICHVLDYRTPWQFCAGLNQYFRQLESYKYPVYWLIDRAEKAGVNRSIKPVEIVQFATR